ncbi:MAG: methionine adenosyltransferase domain-containing protein [Patescibacteria group bacterium]
MSTKTAEFVSPGHPDKICDFIADSILDAYLAEDKNSRVAVEVMGGHNLITINGEITSSGNPDLEFLVKKIVPARSAFSTADAGGGQDFDVKINLVKQSLEISRGVDTGGAGDQGIMKGYATSETESMMPREYDLARNLCIKIYEKYPYDGKVQVTLENEKVKTVVVSFQNTKNSELLELVKSLIKSDLTAKTQASAVEYLINQSGEWTVGGFDADTGLSGRKIVIDNYGPEIPIGGGSFSGKDYTKVDRSGAYIARKIAVDLLKKNNSNRSLSAVRQVFVKLAYCIGKPEPVMAVAILDGKEEKITGYDLTPKGIKELLKLDEVNFAETSKWGHFGRGFSWDR